MNLKHSPFILTVAVSLVLLFAAPAIYAQKKAKIKIVLIGTLHLTPSKEDVYKNKSINLHTKQRQYEIQQVVNKIVSFHPNQVCLEYPIEDQFEMDSIYNAYKAGHYQLKDNERDLFGIQSAKKLGLAKLTCINYSFGNFAFDTIVRFAKENDQQIYLDSINRMATEFLKKADEKLTTLSLSDFLIYINSKEELEKNLSFYTKYTTRIGNDQNYVGANLTADWYSTNIHIYTNLLKLVKPTDKSIVVIFGQGHIPILKHLLNNNSDFEVVEVKDFLK